MQVIVPQLFGLHGHCKVYSRNVFTGEIVAFEEADNLLLTPYKAAVAKDLAYQTTTAKPRAMAFSRDTVASSPEPTVFTNEFRSSVNTLQDSNKLVIISTLASFEGNTEGGTGNIKTIGFYIGDTATIVLGTGTLGSIINTLAVAKNSSLEVTFQYEITFA